MYLDELLTDEMHFTEARADLLEVLIEVVDATKTIGDKHEYEMLIGRFEGCLREKACSYCAAVRVCSWRTGGSHHRH
jgi:hypothetical protein